MTDKQKAFVSVYLSNGLNATQAAIQVGYSPKTARQIGARLLSNVDIRKSIDEKLAKVDSKAICQMEEILQFLSAVVRGEIAENPAPTVRDRISAAGLLSRLLTVSDLDKSTDERNETLIILPPKNPKI